MRLVVSGTVAGFMLAVSLPYAAQADDVQQQPPSTPTATTAPVDVDTATVPAVTDAVAAKAERADDDAADLVAELPARRTDDFGMLGVTWAQGFDATGLSVQVRLRTGGEWASWETLDVESDDGQGEGGRDGTEPLWVGSADGVAVRVTSPSGDRPSGLSVATIDPGKAPSAASGATSAGNALAPATTQNDVVQTADGSPVFTAKPSIISRSAWGAKKNTKCDSPLTGNETRGVLVHHSAGTNSYSKSQSKSIVRGVQAYHMKARKWCDIGYNFLVDKYGQIFEGRNGGVDKPVRGAHSGTKSSNTYTMGVSMMGTFSSAQPSSALKTAMVKLIGWRLGTTFHPATGSYSIGSLKLNRIAGHRNVVSTACPGAAAYKWLSASGGLRDRVKAYIASYSSPIKTRAKPMLAKSGPVYVGEASLGGGRRKLMMHSGYMYSLSSKTQYVYGKILREYVRHGADRGVFGPPKADTVTLASNLVTQSFEKGTIYWVSRSSKVVAYAIWGGADKKYRSLGGPNGKLGTPQKGLTKISGGRYRATFTHGTITRQVRGTFTVAYY